VVHCYRTGPLHRVWSQFGARAQGQTIDRSSERIRQLLTECEALIYRSVELAHELSARLNERLLFEAVIRARETNGPQTPVQVKIAAISRQCAQCDEFGFGAAIGAVPAAQAVLPPGRGLRELFGRKARKHLLSEQARWKGGDRCAVPWPAGADSKPKVGDGSPISIPTYRATARSMSTIGGGR
jgi:hypothetical protein